MSFSSGRCGIAGSLIMLIGTLAFMSPDVYAGTFLKIRIDLLKDRFAVSEPIVGKVVITSSIPGRVPVDFVLKEYKDGRFIRQLVTNMPVFTGTSKISLQDFGLRGFETDPNEEGEWLIVIVGGGDPPASAEARFLVADENDERPK